MGTYATRRSAEFIKNYPENYLRPSLRDKGETGQPPTEAFGTLIHSLQNAQGRLTPKQARELAHDYLTNMEESSDIDFLKIIEEKIVNILDETEGSISTSTGSNPFKITDQLSESDLLIRRKLVKELFEEFKEEMMDDDVSDEIQNPHLAPSWLQEIFYFVPLAIALKLQESGEYLAALDWYQTVYAYSFADNTDHDINERKIYYGLNLERVFPDKPLITPEIWLRDELQPHYLARQRKYAYTRFTILSIVQCLVDYGDAEFASETAESLSGAQSLYQRAIDLLKSPEMPTENPIMESLRQHIDGNLDKLQSGRNIAGMKLPSELDEEDNVEPLVTDNSLEIHQLMFSPPTSYRYSVLIERAKNLVTLSQQLESAFLLALEKQDGEAYSLLHANQDLQTIEETLQLHKLRINEAEGNIAFTKLQQERAEIQSETYREWIVSGLNKWEQMTLENYWNAADAREMAAYWEQQASVVRGYGSISTASFPSFLVSGLSWFGSSYMGNIGENYTEEAILAETIAQTASLRANFERSREEWKLQENLAEQDMKIGAQQIELAGDHLRLAEQEQTIAGLQADNARSAVNFLANKFTNIELYEWMSSVLEGVYSYFLQQATAMARLAQKQLSFQRQERSINYIRADYWKSPTEFINLTNTEGVNEPDRRGLTGSARLLEDIYRLDQYAFETDQRKLQLTQTFSLAQLAPFEFQHFRETGILPFNTSMELFDRSFPGHYLRQIKRVRTSVVALIPPTQGIRATLTASGISKIVTGGKGEPYQTRTIRRQPEQVALTSPIDATGLLELKSVNNEDLLLPFEDMGVDTSWELRMPKASNPLDYDNIADVLVTIEYTALDSPDYRQQVIQEPR